MSTAEATNMVARTTTDWAERLCESPIEVALLRELVRHDVRIVPQAEIGPFRVDFLLNDRVVVECDGHDFHSSKEQRGRDAARDRALVGACFVVLRFTGSEIHADAAACARESAAVATRLGATGASAASPEPQQANLRPRIKPAPKLRPRIERPGLTKPVEVPSPPLKIAPPPEAPPRPDWFALAAAARAEGVAPSARIERLREDLGDCRRCALCHGDVHSKRERKSIVFGAGEASADLMVIGEAPGQQEDERGEPFMGAAGQMLDRWLEEVLGLRRDQVYLTNVVKCRPPKNRNPMPDELDACRPFLDAQITAVEPKLIVVLGSLPYRALLRTDVSVTRARGRWHEYNGIPVMPTFHPVYILRTPGDERLLHEDLKMVRDRYDALGGRR